MSVLTETTITLHDAARRLGKTYGSVYRWLSRPGASGACLEAKKVGGTWYTSLEALDRYGQSRHATGAAAPSHRDPEAARILARFGISH